jgi:SAM-dependent methyltransferase
MSIGMTDPAEVQAIYANRFASMTLYRSQVWRILTSAYFQAFIRPGDAVLDLGCGYGEFINNIRCGARFGMDLNPRSPEFLEPGVRFLRQDCTARWALPDASLDVVFTSNCFEHLPDKLALRGTLAEARRCLRPGGSLIALGPNIKFVEGAYWDFWDHFLCLTDLSVCEAMQNSGFRIRRSIPRFLPYSMVNQPRYPLAFVRLYLAIPLAWRLFGKQFLVRAERA